MSNCLKVKYETKMKKISNDDDHDINDENDDNDDDDDDRKSKVRLKQKSKLR